MTSVKLEKPLEYLKIWKAYGLKISQSIIYVKECFLVFFSTLKDLLQAKSKTNHWIS